MEIFSTLQPLCADNSPVACEFPAQRPVTLSFDVFYDLCLNKWLSKQSWGWWFEMPTHSLWLHYNEKNNMNTVPALLSFVAVWYWYWISNHIHTKVWDVISHPCITPLSFCLSLNVIRSLLRSRDNKVWWLCLVPTSTTRFASDVGYTMAKIWYSCRRKIFFMNNDI